MSGNNHVRIHELRRNKSIIRRFRDWQLWKLRLPLFVMIAVYFVYKFFGPGDEFVNAFGHGDLLLFSALVLIELSVEAGYITHENESSLPDKLEGLIENSRFFGVVLIFLYAGMKIMVDHQSQKGLIDEAKAQAFCILSLCLTFVVVCFSLFAFWRALGDLICVDERSEG